MANPFKGMGGGGGGGMAGMQQQLMSIQKKMVEDAEKMEQRLEAARIDTSAGGGTVKATVSGKGHLLSLKIAKEAVDPDDVEMLEDLVVTAIQEALTKAEAMREEEQQKLMPANIPGLPGLF